MRTSIPRPRWFCSCFSLPSYAQTQSAEVKIAQAKVLVSQLTGDAQRDAAVFRLTGVDHAEEILTALAGRGMEGTAAADAWADLHRAFNSLVELEALSRASVESRQLFGSQRDLLPQPRAGLRGGTPFRATGIRAATKVWRDGDNPSCLYIDWRGSGGVGPLGGSPGILPPGPAIESRSH